MEERNRTCAGWEEGGGREGRRDRARRVRPGGGGCAAAATAVAGQRDARGEKTAGKGGGGGQTGPRGRGAFKTGPKGDKDRTRPGATSPIIHFPATSRKLFGFFYARKRRRPSLFAPAPDWDVVGRHARRAVHPPSPTIAHVPSHRDMDHLSRLWLGSSPLFPVWSDGQRTDQSTAGSNRHTGGAAPPWLIGWACGPAGPQGASGTRMKGGTQRGGSRRGAHASRSKRGGRHARVFLLLGCYPSLCRQAALSPHVASRRVTRPRDRGGSAQEPLLPGARSHPPTICGSISTVYTNGRPHG